MVPIAVTPVVGRTVSVPAGLGVGVKVTVPDVPARISEMDSAVD